MNKRIGGSSPLARTNFTREIEGCIEICTESGSTRCLFPDLPDKRRANARMCRLMLDKTGIIIPNYLHSHFYRGFLNKPKPLKNSKI